MNNSKHVGKLPKQIEYKAKHGTVKDYLAYCELVKKVSLVNPEGALMMTEQWKMPKGEFTYFGKLIGAFWWAGHEKGHYFWRKLSMKVDR